VTTTSPEPGSLLDIRFDKWAEALELSPPELYRARQVQEWVFVRRAKSFDEMTNVPAALRTRWAEKLRLRTLRVVRREKSKLDDTTRFHFQAGDGVSFPAVFLPNASTEEDERSSLCLSSQSGCAWECAFCASGKVAFQRNLLPSEILEQLLWVEEESGGKIDGVLFMGMGEPLANFENVVEALKVLRSPLGFGYGARHVTVSTCGLVPQVERLATEAPKTNLAISLHAVDDETRQRLMPKAARFSVKDVLKAAWEWQRVTGGARVTFEYILLKGVNDSLREAQRLSNFLRGKKAFVNLIVYNAAPNLPFSPSDDEAVSTFVQTLEQRGLFVRVRKPQGADIAAGCGQLGAPSTSV
jgi:23S rRNA (adenine2503-C2)-methyltransferase